ncbi:hypothetical protein DN613_06025 [Aeromonas caviae]|nr:hypothetical protein DN613_06025 [Aeromonas caviae]
MPYDLFAPSLELARVLFLHDGYLSRSALEPDYLRSEFSIEYPGPNVARVNVLPSSREGANKYPMCQN